MSITVEVGLLSGKKATVEAGWEEEVETKIEAAGSSYLGVQVPNHYRSWL